ncbi:MAG: amidohydrolase [Clostridia bacterium]|nr:amidohydrolase [Clostridia bacterium]
MKQLFVNGQVFTGTGVMRSAFAEENGKFIAVGSTEEILSLKEENDQVIDLANKFVCAGFIDSHMHLVNYGNVMGCCNLMEHTTSVADIQQALRDFIAAEKIPAGSWVRGRGWNQDYFVDNHDLPTRAQLDEVSTEHPICITRCCGHSLVVNSKALEVLGIDTVEKIDGGAYDLATGAFFDSAMTLVYARLPQPGRAEIKEMILRACKGLNALGVTGSHTDDLCAFENTPWQEVIAAYHELEAEKKLTVRVYEQSQLTTPEALREFLAAGYKTGVGSDMFKIGPLKLLGDGSLGARTAYMSKGYADQPDERGLAIFTQEQFDEMICLAHENGMQIAIHAIGDGILDRILLSYEKAFALCPREDHRSGIVHVQLTRPEQLKKMQRLNLHAYIQSIFLDYDINIVEARAGKELASTSYAFHTLKQMGLHVSNGTDCPVEMPRALHGIQCAVTRCTLSGKGPYRPEEAMDVSEALLSYTAESAHASFDENVKGKIQPGMLADFVVLSDSPFRVPANKISAIQVEKTFLGGACVYEREA